ncbi:MAG: UbiD family decarboxylase [Gammaproteobacteria bacterium]|nr:UbiD family decarboxylase [Gammaproteobacteria bacterium]MBT8443218.1 UbiD family decarboxylase [Gammaproteobacteria bacterium]NND37779.1 hypothetical protein [Gammaproteobacteria bacterium]
MSDENDTKRDEAAVTRRAVLAGGALAALSAQVAAASGAGAAWPAAAMSSSKIRKAPRAPFDSFRDYMEAIEAWGLVLRVPRVDQDNYELTALMYRLIDEYGWYEAPAILAEEVRIDGTWVKGPVICNHQGHWYTEGLTFGITPTLNDGKQTYRDAMAYLKTLLVKGEYPELPPVEVAAGDAPCKEVVLTGDDIDLTKYAFIKSNPADSRRYINTGSTFTEDPVIGKNFGTYRCELRGPRLIGINPEPNQTAWRTFMAAKERGEKTVKVSIVVGQDPIVWMISGSRIVNRLQKRKFDELAIAGGMRGKPIEVVKSETNDHMIPAHAEMVIEGEVPLDKMMPEGPFGEMYQYLGAKRDENFIVNVTAVTHRRKPWILNQFTGVTRGYVTGPTAVLFNEGLRRLVPGMIEIHSPVDTTGLTYVKIKKTRPGEGLEIGEKLAKIIPIYKVVVIVDEDVDVLDPTQVNVAIGSRWRPKEASLVIEGMRGMPLDPTVDPRGKVSKIVIDATIPWPEEGGPEEFAKLNRTWLEELAPESFDLVEEKWGDVIRRKYTTF